MDLVYRRSISYPQIMLRSDGKAFDAETMQPLTATKNHGHSFRGCLVYIRLHNRSYHLSLIRLMYEAFHYGAKLPRELQVITINGDDNDCRAENLAKWAKVAERKKKKESKDNRIETESFHNWNDSAIYC